MKLYEEILFLMGYVNCKWVVENVISWYDPLIKPKMISRHYFWSNYVLNEKNFELSQRIKHMVTTKDHYGFDIKTYKLNHRKDQILRTAAKMFCERTFHGTTLQDIAQEVGMLKGSLYYYITSKEKLLVDIITTAVHSLYEGLWRVESAKLEPAERELKLALEADGRNFDFQYALLDHYLKRGMFEEARPIAESMASMHPQNPVGMQALEYIRQATGK